MGLGLRGEGEYESTMNIPAAISRGQVWAAKSGLAGQGWVGLGVDEN